MFESRNGARRLYTPRHISNYRKHYEATSPELAKRQNPYLERIEDFARQIGARDVLDYGCGYARGISRFSTLPVTDYDPGVWGLDREPQQHDLVVSVHALEHVESTQMIDVLSHMFYLARRGVFIVVSCKPSTKLLPDGSPWHATVLSPTAWSLILWDMTRRTTIKPSDEEFAATWVRR